MELGLKEVKQMSSKEIFESLEEIINSVFQEFQYLEISEKEYSKIVLNEISMSKKNYKGDISYSNFIVNCISKSLIDVSKNTARTPELKFKIINNYINQKLADTLTVKDTIECFDSLSYVLEMYGYVPDPDFLEMLINQNKIFNTTIHSVVKYYSSQIMSGNLESIFNNNLLISSIETYCSINKIEIKNDDFEQDLNNFSSVTDSLRIYLHEICEKPLLTAEEEKELAKRVASGDEEARNKFIDSNLRLVVSIAKRYANRGLPLLDLIQEGNFGLMTAVDKFDPSKNFRFSSCAYYWIRQAITRAIDNKGRNVRIPVSMHQKINLYMNTVRTLASKLGRQPTFEEIANEMKLPISNVITIYEASNPEISINCVVDEDDKTELINFVPSPDESVEDVAIQNMLRDDINKLFDKSRLNEKEKAVLSLRYGLGGQERLSLVEIGKIYGCTRERIRQIESRALDKIRNSDCIGEFAVYAQHPDRVLKNIREGGFEMKGIYKYLKDFKKEQIDAMLLKLSEDEIELLKLKFGDDLSGACERHLSKAQAARFYSSLVPEMKNIMKYPNYVPKNKRRRARKCAELTSLNNEIQEAVPVVNENMDSIPLEKVATTVQEERKSTLGSEFIAMKNADDIAPAEETIPLASDVKEKTPILSRNKKTNCDEANVIPTIKSITPSVQESKAKSTLENDDITKSECEGILKLLRTPSFGQMLNLLSVKEAVIVSLKLGYVDEKYFSNESIANFLGITKEEVIETTKKILLLYKENINEFLDKIIETASGNEKDSKKIIK